MVVPIWAKARTSVSRSVLNPLASPLTPAGCGSARLEATGRTVVAGSPAPTGSKARSLQRSLGRRYTWANGTALPPPEPDHR